MKWKNYFLTILFFCVFHSVHSQVKLDTIFIQNKKSMQSSTQIRYYYYPNLQVYYDTQESTYICKRQGQWVNMDHIPNNYRGYSMKNGIYVVLKGYIEDEPYKHIEQHKKDYPADYSSRRKTKVIVREE